MTTIDLDVLTESERAKCVAYIRDRAGQYEQSSGIVAALHDVARDIHEGRHREAAEHGELDDLYIEVWLPTLGEGAPTNEAGMLSPWTPYRSREGALAHEHWPNQQPWASAYQVIVTNDRPQTHSALFESIVRDAETLGRDAGPTVNRAAHLTRRGRYVEAIRVMIDGASVPGKETP